MVKPGIGGRAERTENPLLSGLGARVAFKVTVQFLLVARHQSGVETGNGTPAHFSGHSNFTLLFHLGKGVLYVMLEHNPGSIATTTRGLPVFRTGHPGQDRKVGI